MQPVPQGCEATHDGNCVTVFGAPNYAGDLKNIGGYVEVSFTHPRVSYGHYKSVVPPEPKRSAPADSGKSGEMFMKGAAAAAGQQVGLGGAGGGGKDGQRGVEEDDGGKDGQQGVKKDDKGRGEGWEQDGSDEDDEGEEITSKPRA